MIIQQAHQEWHEKRIKARTDGSYKNIIILKVHGSTKKNPGPATAAYMILKDGQLLASRNYYLGIKTSNFAIYIAIILGLTEILARYGESNENGEITEVVILTNNINVLQATRTMIKNDGPNQGSWCRELYQLVYDTMKDIDAKAFLVNREEIFDVVSLAQSQAPDIKTIECYIAFFKSHDIEI